MGKIFSTDATKKGLISDIQKQLIQVNIEKTKNPIKKWEKTQILFQRRHTDGQQAHEKMCKTADYC